MRDLEVYYGTCGISQVYNKVLVVTRFLLHVLTAMKSHENKWPGAHQGKLRPLDKSKMAEIKDINRVYKGQGEDVNYIGKVKCL